MRINPHGSGAVIGIHSAESSCAAELLGCPLRLRTRSRPFETAESRSERQLVAEHRPQANISEEKHSWDRVPAWDGDRRQWKRYLRDVELKLETEKLDVDFSHGARLLSRLTGSARKYAETIKLDTIRRSTGENKDTRGRMVKM